MPRHIFTAEETAKGSRAGAKQRALTRKMIRAQGEKQWLELMQTAISNPAVVGTLLYLGVGYVKQRNQQQAQQQQAPANPVNNFINQWKFNFGQFLGTVGIPVNSVGALSNLNLDGLGIDALQVALLAYIASGGNLSGTLQSGANILKTVLPGVAAVP